MKQQKQKHKQQQNICFFYLKTRRRRLLDSAEGRVPGEAHRIDERLADYELL